MTVVALLVGVALILEGLIGMTAPGGDHTDRNAILARVTLQ